MKTLVSIQFMAFLVVLLVATAGCGKSEEPKPEETTPVAAEPAADARPTPPGLPPLPAFGSGQQPPEDLTKILAEAQAKMAAGLNPSGEPVNQIDWKELVKALPGSVDGWKMDGEVAGSSAKMMGMSVSQAECKFNKGDSKAHITIIDTSMNPMIAMPFSMARAIEIDSDKETRGPVAFGAHPGTKAFMKKRNKAEVLVMVKNRLLVTVRVDAVQSSKPAEELVKSLKLDQLAALVK